jgi:hypothetical protein
MSRKIAFVSIVALPLALGYSSLGLGEDRLSAGMWSKRAVPLAYSGSARRVVVPAPNDQSQVVVEGNGIQVVRAGQPLVGTEKVGIGTLAEVLWAADSRAFLITESDGGIVGTWTVRMFLVEPMRVDSRLIAPDVAHRFKKQFKCREPEEPNVGATGWSEDSRWTLLVAEVPPHSTCPDMGKVRGYRVSTKTGKIVEELTQERLKTHWVAFFGDRLSWLKGPSK